VPFLIPSVGGSAKSAACGCQPLIGTKDNPFQRIRSPSIHRPAP
jgi:hypothetical protein